MVIPLVMELSPRRYCPQAPRFASLVLPIFEAQAPHIRPPVPTPRIFADTRELTAMDLLERNPQLEELSRHLRDAGRVAGRVVFVSGEAGAGKSSLLEEFTRRAGEARVLWGLCDALQTSRVLGPVNEVVAGLASRAATNRA